MIGGFLGAGKTTAIGKLAQHLTSQELKVGLITNDGAKTKTGRSKTHKTPCA